MNCLNGGNSKEKKYNEDFNYFEELEYESSLLDFDLSNIQKLLYKNSIVERSIFKEMNLIELETESNSEKKVDKNDFTSNKISKQFQEQSLSTIFMIHKKFSEAIKIISNTKKILDDKK